MLKALGLIGPRSSKTLVHNLRIHFWEGLTFDAGFSLVNPDVMLPSLAVLLLRRAGGHEHLENRAGVLFTVLFAVTFGVFPLVASFLAQGRKRILPLALLTTLGQRIPWYLGLLILPLWAVNHPLRTLIVLYASWAFYSMSTGLIVPLWQHLIAVTIPVGLRGRLFGWIGFFARILAWLLFLGSPWLLRSLPFPWGWVGLFAGACAGTTASFIIFMRLKEPPARNPGRRIALRAYLSEIPKLLRQDKALRAFLTYRVLGSVVALGTQALVTVRAQSLLGRTEGDMAGLVGLLSGASYLFLALGFPLWGWLADRTGWKLIEAIYLVCTALAFLVAIPAKTALGFGVSMALLGLASAAIWLSFTNFVLEFGPSRDKVLVSALSSLARFPASLLPLLGGYLADRWGSQWALGLAALASLAALILLWALVPEPRKAVSAPPLRGEG